MEVEIGGGELKVCKAIKREMSGDELGGVWR